MTKQTIKTIHYGGIVDGKLTTEALEVSAHVIGVYGVHKGCDGNGYRITHVPSGFVIGYTSLLRHAKAAAEMLHKVWPDMGAAWKWGKPNLRDYSNNVIQAWQRDINAAVARAENPKRGGTGHWHRDGVTL